MNRVRLLRLLLIAASLLALVAVMELTLGRDVPTVDAPGSGAPGSDQAAAPYAAPRNAPQAAAPTEGELAAWVEASLARPLFRPDRRPALQPREPDAAAPASEVLPRLAAIILAGRVRYAVFQPGGAVKPILLGEGGTIGAWRIAAIALQSVTLQGREGTRKLAPHPDPSARLFNGGAPGAEPPPAGAGGMPGPGGPGVAPPADNDDTGGDLPPTTNEKP